MSTLVLFFIIICVAFLILFILKKVEEYDFNMATKEYIRSISYPLDNLTDIDRYVDYMKNGDPRSIILCYRDEIFYYVDYCSNGEVYITHGNTTTTILTDEDLENWIKNELEKE